MIKAFVFDAYGTLYDVQSVIGSAEAAFPGRGALISQIWRLKQLEYSWLRSMMRYYQNFESITRHSLAYTLDVLGQKADDETIDKIVESYNRLIPYPDSGGALAELGEYKLAILSNGSPQMLNALVGNSTLARYIDVVISVDSKKVYKPDPRAYELVEEHLGLSPDEIIFVSSNGFDACGAKRFGFRVAQIKRIQTDEPLKIVDGRAEFSPMEMFKALRMQQENLGCKPDFVISSLAGLASLPSIISQNRDSIPCN